MEITDVQITPSVGDGKLLAYASVLIDDSLCIRDLKIVDGSTPFVAMPARRHTFHCRECRQKNALTARFCNWCGITLDGGCYCQTCEGSGRYEGESCRTCDGNGKIRLYADIVHPINRGTREMFTAHVLSAYYEDTGDWQHPKEIHR